MKGYWRHTCAYSGGSHILCNTKPGSCGPEATAGLRDTRKIARKKNPWKSARKKNGGFTRCTRHHQWVRLSQARSPSSTRAARGGGLGGSCIGTATSTASHPLWRLGKCCRLSWREKAMAPLITVGCIAGRPTSSNNFKILFNHCQSSWTNLEHHRPWSSMVTHYQSSWTTR